jgi:hypothetical protein
MSSQRMSDSAPLYGLIIVLAFIVAGSSIPLTALWLLR